MVTAIHSGENLGLRSTEDNGAAEHFAVPIANQLQRSVDVLREVLGAAVVEVVAAGAGAPTCTSLARSMRTDISEEVFALFHHQLDRYPWHGGKTELQVTDVPAPGWRITLVPVVDGDDATGVVLVGHDSAGCLSEIELTAIRAVALLCGLVRTRVASEREALHQRSLDELVTNVAVELMSVSRQTIRDALATTLRSLAEFFEVDTVFMRANDLERDLSILVDEWPRRENVPDPDPLGVVPFEADPVFAATRDLAEPYIMRPQGSSESYQERINDGAGIPQVSMAMVPLVDAGGTTGVLGFIKFGDRPWATAEINALRAIASLLVQLQARIDAEERLQYNAFYDQLTGLANRRALLEELGRRLAPEADGKTALLFMDLDRFKTMNDFLGHQAGDRLLVMIAERVRAALRPNDFAARLGGDEFVIVLAGDSDSLEASAVADRMLELVAMPIELDGHHIHRTGSIGIAFAHAGEMTAEELLGHADAALYTAKDQGRNRAVIFDDALRAAVDERSDTEMLLREVIDQGGLQLYYHPEIDLRTGELLACEALVRWQHPVRGFLPAGAFIKVAEETGLVVDLGRWVLNEACRQMSEWMRVYPFTDMCIRVNMSPAQLVSRNIVDLVASCLERHGLPGERLCIEITEHAVMQDVDRAIGILREFRALGVGLAIDDFGTGFSSMAQLKRLPVDTLKVDRSFVTGLGTDPGDRAIVESIVRLAQAFSLDLVAEGVETVTHIDQLLELGCYRSQGFLLSLPLPAAAMEAMIRRGRIEIPDDRAQAA